MKTDYKRGDFIMTARGLRVFDFYTENGSCFVTYPTMFQRIQFAIIKWWKNEN